MPPFFIPHQGNDLYSGKSFQSLLISRIVASIKHFLFVQDKTRVETGLVTLLRLTGYISGDFVHLLFLYFQLEAPKNYAVLASKLFTLKPRFAQYFDVGFLDKELLYCAFFHRSAAGINQMLLRLESNDSFDSSLIKIITALGIPGVLNAGNAHRAELNAEFIERHAMAAHVASCMPDSTLPRAIGREGADGPLSIRSDFASFNLTQASWSKVKHFLFERSFLAEYTEMVERLFSSPAYAEMSARDKLEKLAILMCLRVFHCPADRMPDLLRSIFSELLYLRVSVRGIPTTPDTIDSSEGIFDELPLFTEPFYSLVPSIRLFLQE